MTIRYSSSVARRAVVKSVNYSDGTLTTRWLDDDSDGPTIPIPHPFGNKGGSGIFVGIKIGTVIVLVMGNYKTYMPVAVLPTKAYYSSDMAGTPEADYDDLNFPALSSGDIVIQGPTGSVVGLYSGTDELVLVNEFGEGIIIGGGSNSSRCSMRLETPTSYVISQYGIRASGIIRRDVKIEESEDSFIDFLTDLDSEQSLEEIGWHPNKLISYMGGGVSVGNDGGDFGRNPPFVEDRQIIYEFGKNWMVGSIEEERSRLSACIPLSNSATDRSERRSNALSLSLANPNELIEKISGTVVDVFGNPLDINRKIIDTSLIDTANTAEDMLKQTLEVARHGVAYHMEINARKGIHFDTKHQDTKKPESFVSWSEAISSVSNNARDRSRWFIDVDKEGLTKINIPATSETGNVPVIARYENSSVLNISSKGEPSTKGRETIEDTKKLYRNEKNRDIFTEQVGPGGIKILGNPPDNRMSGKKTSWVEKDSKVPSGSITQAKMGTIIESGTAFHDITKTAWALIKKNINNPASAWALIVERDPDAPTPAEAGLQAISKEINPKFPENNVTPATQNPNNSGLLDNQPNAGGRSVHMNLDGSLETSIGANTIDRVSWILDTAGALIWRLGRDRSGRSAIIQADGTVALEVGGFDYIGTSGNDEVDTRFVGRGEARENILKLDPNQFRSGKLIIKIRRATDDKSGPADDDTLLIIDDTGVTVTTPGRLSLVSGQDMTLQSKTRIILDSRVVQIYKDQPRYVAKSGRPIL